MIRQHLPHPTEVLNVLWRSPEMLQAQQERVRDPMAKIAMGDIAQQVAERLERGNRGYETDESRQMRFTGAISGWVKAEKRLFDHRNGDISLTKEERTEFLETVDVLNHTIRDMIDNEQYTKMSQISRFVEGVLLNLRAPSDMIGFAKSSIGGIVHGMRTEIAAQSVISSLPGVYGLRGAETRDEERRARDIIVNYLGYEVCLDIKASEKRAAEAREEHPYSESIFVWSGFTAKDFGDRLVLDDEQLRAQRPRYTRILEAAVLHQHGIVLSA